MVMAKVWRANYGVLCTLYVTVPCKYRTRSLAALFRESCPNVNLAPERVCRYATGMIY